MKRPECTMKENWLDFVENTPQEIKVENIYKNIERARFVSSLQMYTNVDRYYFSTEFHAIPIPTQGAGTIIRGCDWKNFIGIVFHPRVAGTVGPPHSSNRLEIRRVTLRTSATEHNAVYDSERFAIPVEPDTCSTAQQHLQQSANRCDPKKEKTDSTSGGRVRNAARRDTSVKVTCYIIISSIFFNFFFSYVYAIFTMDSGTTPHIIVRTRAYILQGNYSSGLLCHRSGYRVYIFVRSASPEAPMKCIHYAHHNK